MAKRKAYKTYLVKSGEYKGTEHNDLFTTTKNAGKFTIDAKSGNDTITVSSGKSGSRILVGAGSDTVKVTGGKVGVITLGPGNNTVKVTGGTVGKINAKGTTTKTKTEIIVSNQKNIKIEQSGASDTITVNGFHNDLLSKASRAKILTRGGTDIITINKGGCNSIQTGSGKDKVTINGGSSYVNTGSGNDIITVNSKYGNYIKGGSGRNSITLGKDARYCVVGPGGAEGETITVKSKASGKIGNMVKGGNNATYNIHYTGQTIVVDARLGVGDPGKYLNIYADYSALSSLVYYKKSNVMEINGNAHILGFSQLRKINIYTNWGNYKFSPREVIADATVSDKAFSINNLLKPYNSIMSLANGIGNLSDKTAKYLGYKGR